jgi:MYXO-CTERM domain-containing protein
VGARALAVAISLGAGRAHANGAFPDSLRIFVPADRPAEIILATNFGLIISRDDGATWDWVCEHGDGYLASQYQHAAPPSRRLFGVAPGGLVYTDDDACSWSLAADLTSTTVIDAFADPVNPNRVLALASFVDPGGQPKNGLFVSADAGKTFGAPRYLAPPESTLYSVEVAASNADRVYVTTFRANLGVLGSAVVRSDDGGGTWTVSDVTAVTGDRIVRIAAIDPLDPQKVFFRVTGSEDAIGLTNDGGATLTLPLVVTTQLTGFLRRPNGQILVSALDLVDGALYQSTDSGQSFSRMATRLSIRALAERSGKLYVATDNFMDGFALAVSTDDGATFEPLLRFDQVRGVRACGNLVAACVSSCSALINVGLFTPSTCANRDAGPENGLKPPPSSSKGCGCHVWPGDRPSVPGLSAFAIVVALVRRRRR